MGCGKKVYQNDTIFAEKQKKSVFLAHVPYFYLYLCGAKNKNIIQTLKNHEKWEEIY